jgi:type III pantothenate kinase
LLLLIDQGNSDTKFAVSDGAGLFLAQRLPTERGRSAAEYADAISPLLMSSHRRFQACAISTVVPSEQHALRALCTRFFRCPSAIVGVDLQPKLRTKLHHPKRLGSDRVANALGAHRHYAGRLLIVDSGTALKFDLVTADGTFESGIIAPGIWTSANAMLERCAMLANTPLEQPCCLIGKSTASGIGSGVYYGHFAMVEGLIRRIRSSVSGPLTVVATGGAAPLLIGNVEGIDVFDELLTLKGLLEVWESR